MLACGQLQAKPGPADCGPARTRISFQQGTFRRFTSNRSRQNSVLGVGVAFWQLIRPVFAVYGVSLSILDLLGTWER